MNFPTGNKLVKNFLFFPQSQWDDQPENWGLRHEEVMIPVTKDSEISALWFPQDGEARETIILPHGNAGNISHRLFKVAPLIKKGFQVLLFDYRGYGKSTGDINNEEDLYKDGEAALNWLKEKKGIEPQSVVVLGESVGCAVALELAVRYPVKAVILESPFTSLRDMAKTHYPLMPAFLVKGFELNNLEKVKQIKAPLLHIHGTRDSICPFSMGETLFSGAQEPKEIFVVQNGDHNDIVMVAGNEYFDRIDRFIKNLS